MSVLGPAPNRWPGILLAAVASPGDRRSAARMMYGQPPGASTGGELALLCVRDSVRHRLRNPAGCAVDERCDVSSVGDDRSGGAKVQVQRAD